MAFITVDPSLPDPVHSQIVDQIEAAIENGELPIGASLPTVRQLARDLQIAPNTVVRAYTTLQEHHWIVGDGRRGTTVSKHRPKTTVNDRLKKLRAALDRLVEIHIYRGYSPDQISEALDSVRKRLRT
jgi:DNA-binding transcriptional regulator YhcF (GntR family)